VDAALVTVSGGVLGAARWRSHRAGGAGAGEDVTAFDDGEDRHVAGATRAVEAVCRNAGLDPGARPVADVGVYCLAGADLPVDDRRLSRAVARHDWTTTSLVRNDTFAVLRAGSDRGWGIAVVCGHGMNAAGMAPDGRTFRFPAKGDVSGDWGGGADLGRSALWYAVRSDDGRGDSTELARAVPGHFRMRGTKQLVEAFHLGRVGEGRLGELAPVVFRVAGRGDAVARAILDRQADEVAAMAAVVARRLRLSNADVDVVLGGGVFRNRDRTFARRVQEGVLARLPGARITVLTAPPVVGAALLGLDHIGASASASDRVRRELTHERMAGAGRATAATRS
jgi:N-acetylglucosamine kinase-like BadF-type ATPase